MEKSEQAVPKSSGIAAQESLAAVFEIFAAAANQHFGDDLAGKLMASCGMSGTIAMAPLGAAMNRAAALGIDGDAEQIKSLVKTGYYDVMVNDLDEALRLLKNAVRKREAVVVGLVANYAELVPALAKRGVVPDLLVGSALNFDGVSALQRLGTIALEWKPDTTEDPLLPSQHAGRGKVTMIASSGEPKDIRRLDALLLELFSANAGLCRWVRSVSQRIRFEGTPTRVCWLTPEETNGLAAELNRLSESGQFTAPITIKACGWNE